MILTTSTVKVVSIVISFELIPTIYADLSEYEIVCYSLNFDKIDIEDRCFLYYVYTIYLNNDKQTP